MRHTPKAFYAEKDGRAWFKESTDDGKVDARRASDNLVWPRWPQPTPEGLRYSWGCSNAVVILQVVHPPEPTKKPEAQ